MSVVVSSANGVGAMEGWIDPAFGDLEPLQEPIDFFQDMIKQPYVVDAVDFYYNVAHNNTVSNID